MTTQTKELEQALALVRRLSSVEKVRLVEQVMAALEKDLTEVHPRKSARGLWAGIHISEEDIAEARHEMWSGFPRGDI